MTDKRQSGSTTTKKELFGENYSEMTEFKSTGRLSSGAVVIGRMLALCKRNAKGERKAMSREAASKAQ